MLEKEASMKIKESLIRNRYRLYYRISWSVFLILSLLFLSVLSINLSSATVGKGDPFFNLSQSGFAAGSVLEGFVNFSLTNHPADAIVTATINPGSIVKEMFLVDFLRNASAIFNCSQDCIAVYTATSGEEEKILSLGNEERYLGLKVNGMHPQIVDLSFEVTGIGNVGEGVCGESPFKVDLLDDGSSEFEYDHAIDNSWCGEPRLSSCFDPLYATQSSQLTTTSYCEKIKLNKTALLEVSVLLRVSQGDPSGENDIDFSVWDAQGNKKGNCNTSVEDLSFTNVSCDIGIDESGEPTNFYIDHAGDYFVCVKLSHYIATPKYEIQKESHSPVCGFYGTPPTQNFVEDYGIYVKEAKFAVFDDDIIFNETNTIGKNGLGLLPYIQNYIDTRYGGNCTNECVIPMKIRSLTTQTLILNNLLLEFQPEFTGPSSSKLLYEVGVTQPKINMTKQSLPFKAMNVTAPEQSNAVYHLSLNISGTLSQIINFKVASVPVVQSVTPLNVAPNVNTLFRVTVQNAGTPIVSYNWGWDGTPSETTIIPEASHSYSEGPHNLVVKVTDSAGLTATGTFVVNASLSIDTVNQSLMQKKSAYNSIGSQISSLWYKDLIYNASQISAALSYIESQLTNPSANLNALKTQLDELKIPVAINDTLVFQESTYFPDIDQIDLSHLSDIGAGFYDSSLEDKYKNAIGNWQGDINYRLGGSNKRVTFDDGLTQEISLMIIRVSPSTSQNIYFVLNIPSGTTRQQIKSQENLQFHEFSDALGITLTQSQVMNLAIPSSQDFSQIVFYASPEFSTLNVGGNNGGGGTGEPGIVLPIIVAAVIFIAVIVVLLFIWKKKSSGDTSQGFELGQNYGNPGGSLFANPDDLIGLVGYIQSSLAEGKDKNLIEQELLESGWTKEQIKEGFKQTRT
ncbi:MAG: PKD domain-containing protein [Candidatus Pacearchaeota archaeon]|nr:PKD domain-containing protein [Candidatus Pacearchaeota archaeon]